MQAVPAFDPTKPAQEVAPAFDPSLPATEIKPFDGDHIGPEPGVLERYGSRVKAQLGGLVQGTAQMLATGLQGAGPAGAAEATRLLNLARTGAKDSALEWVPVVGPVLAPIANRLRIGDVAGAAGDLTGLALPEILGAGVAGVKGYRAAGAPGRAAANLAGKDAAFTKGMMQAFPPSPAHPYGAPELQMVKSALAAEHAVSPITTSAEALAAMNRGIGAIETHVQAAVDHFPNLTVQVPVRDIETALSTGGGGVRTPPVRGMGARSTDAAQGMAAIETLGLDQPMSLPELYTKVLRLNGEITAELGKSKYDVAEMRRTDPEFRALELAADLGRSMVYDRLQQAGVPGIRELRAQEGALIQVRSAAARHEFAGESLIRNTGADTLGRRILARVVKAGATGTGAVAGGLAGGAGAVGGAVAGSELGDLAASAIRRPNQTRNVLIERTMRNLEGLPGTRFPPLPAHPPPGVAMGAPRQTPPPGRGPLPTVTVMPPQGAPQLGAGTPPLALPAAPPRMLPSHAIELPPPGGLPPEAASVSAPVVPNTPLPKTWAEVRTFHGPPSRQIVADVAKGLGQDPKVIGDILSTPAGRVRDRLIARIERGQ